MRCTVVLEFDAGEADQPPQRIELMRFHRDTASPTPGDVGMTLDEGKTLLLAVQQEFIVEQVAQFFKSRRACPRCYAPRRLHDARCSEVKTIFGNVNYCRERWKACRCGADGLRYVSPLKNYLPAACGPELRWLHATLGAMLPYRQACTVMQLLLPLGGRHNHVTLRNHTLATGAAVQADAPLPVTRHRPVEQEAGLGIDVG